MVSESDLYIRMLQCDLKDEEKFSEKLNKMSEIEILREMCYQLYCLKNYLIRR